MPIKIAINGFGRIGRPVFRAITDNYPDLQVVAINDLADLKTLVHLLQYDSLYGRYEQAEQALNGVKFFSEKDPQNLAWQELAIDIVLECTGEFTDYQGAKKHLTAGAKKVIISAPSKEPDKIPSFVLGVNEDKLDSKKYDILDMASCTTNCLAPLAKIINDNFQIAEGFMTTVHSYTNDQRILDLPHKDLRRARAAAINLIPTSTGAAKAIGRVIPELEGKLDGIALRVPTPTVSIVDLICQTERKTSVEEVNSVFKKAAEKKELKAILAVEETPLVSTDFVGNTHSAILDLPSTMVKDNLIKVLAWYDNEFGYAARLADFTALVAKKLPEK